MTYFSRISGTLKELVSPPYRFAITSYSSGYFVVEYELPSHSKYPSGAASPAKEIKVPVGKLDVGAGEGGDGDGGEGGEGGDGGEGGEGEGGDGGVGGEGGDGGEGEGGEGEGEGSSLSKRRARLRKLFSKAVEYRSNRYIIFFLSITIFFFIFKKVCIIFFFFD